MEKIFVAIGFNVNGFLQTTSQVKYGKDLNEAKEKALDLMQNGKASSVGIFEMVSYGRMPNPPLVWETPQQGQQDPAEHKNPSTIKDQLNEACKPRRAPYPA